MSETGLQLIDLNKRYGTLIALDRLSLHARPGEMHGFVGPNGAGKTTAMRIAIGVLDADQGEVHWQGRPAGPEQRRRIGYMPEERGLYPKMRVADQLVYLAELHGRDARTAQERTDYWLDRLGISDRACDRVEQLSLGNQQRVQLAASLIFDPDLLVLDEPFSGLDPIGIDVLSEVLLEVCREREVPVLFSSHQLELVERLCHRVTIIKAGRVQASGEVEELRMQRSDDLWRLEFADDLAPDGPTPAGIERVGQGVYRLEIGTDPQRLLDFGIARGRVREFGPKVATLAELFRETVASEPDAEPEASEVAV